MPDQSIVTAIQAERIVECFEADLWGGACDPQTFRDTVQVACEQSLVPTLSIDDRVIERIRERLQAFKREWLLLPIGRSCILRWSNDKGIAG
jgi:hypothetical protein